MLWRWHQQKDEIVEESSGGKEKNEKIWKYWNLQGYFHKYLEEINFKSCSKGKTIIIEVCVDENSSLGLMYLVIPFKSLFRIENEC